MSELYIVSSSPHVRSKDSVERTMLDVIIALTPAALFSIYYFKLSAVLAYFFCIGFSVLAEWLYMKVLKQRNTVKDLSAVVTGMLLAMNLPGFMPLNHIWWVALVGSFVAIIIVKQLFGGLGQNFMNPALGARAFLLISFAGIMTTWGPTIDGITTATPLAVFKEYGVDLISSATPVAEWYTVPSLMDAFVGMIPGSLGETSALALILGGLYLMYRKVISFRIPVTFIGTTALMIIVIGGEGLDMTYLGYHLFSGGLVLGAFFMATDYSSSPTTAVGQIIMGVGCGVLTALIRVFGGYPEGVSFAILIMNLFVPLIDKYTVPTKFGEVK